MPPSRGGTSAGSYKDGKRSPDGFGSLVGPADAGDPPLAMEARHLWAGLGVTWQTEGAVWATSVCGARGDGVADDWQALQSCVDAVSPRFVAATI